MRLPRCQSTGRLLLRSGFVAAILGASAVGLGAGASRAATAPMTTPGLKVATIALPPGATSGRMYLIACATATYCVAGGFATFATGKQSAVTSVESGGAWSTPQILSATLSRLSCPRAGACVALGLRRTSAPTAAIARYTAYLFAQHGSTWSAAQTIDPTGLGPNPDVVVTALSCPRALWCIITATQIFSPSHTRVFALTWRNGHWSSPHFFSSHALGAGAQLASLNALSCVGDWCQGVGVFTDAHQRIQPFTLTYAKGHWRSIHELGAYLASTNTNGLGHIVCSAVNTCVAAGYSAPVATNVESPMFVEENHARWSRPDVLSTPVASTVNSLSCATATRCAAVLSVATRGIATFGVTMMGSNRHWSPPLEVRVAGQAEVQGYGIWCLPGRCAIAGSTRTSTTASSQPTIFTVKISR